MDRSSASSRFVAALVVAWAATGCDVGSSSGTPPGTIDPNDDGSDQDVGAGDLGPTPVEIHGALQVVGTELRDQNGDPVQLKGVSSMWLNWEPDGYARNVPALKWMRNNWHLQVIRASMGIEPEGAYLGDPGHSRADLETVVDNAIEAGVYVIVDWHDHHAQDHQAQAVDFFGSIAEKYGDLPNVIYEPYNEPLDVDWNGVVRPYHEAVIAAIRSSDPDNVVVLGTPKWSQDVDFAAQSQIPGANLMYTLHFYSCSHTSWLREKADAAIGAGLPLFVSEWGATAADGGLDGKTCLDEARTWHSWMNGHGIGWTAWKLDNCGSDASCILASNAPLSGGWTSTYLQGHGVFVRARIQDE